MSCRTLQPGSTVGRSKLSGVKPRNHFRTVRDCSSKACCGRKRGTAIGHDLRGDATSDPWSWEWLAVLRQGTPTPASVGWRFPGRRESRDE